MKTKHLTAIAICIALFSCESEKQRINRISEDVYAYETFKPQMLHLDVNCKKIHESESYKTILKSTLRLSNNSVFSGFIFGTVTEYTFCPICSKPADIERLKNQLKNN